MNAADKRHVLQGEVFCDGRWVPIETKARIARDRRKKIEAGYVFYQGEWITIDEKLARVTPPKPPEEKRPATVIINRYDNRTVYNVDNRTVHRHDHRHVHIAKEALEEYARQRLPGKTADAAAAAIGSAAAEGGALPEPKTLGALPDRKKPEAQPGGNEHDAIGDGRNIAGLLGPPEEPR